LKIEKCKLRVESRATVPVASRATAPLVSGAPHSNSRFSIFNFQFSIAALLFLACVSLWAQAPDTPTPASQEAQVSAIADEVQQKVVKVRGLQFQKPVAKGVKNRAELRDYILALLRKEMPKEKIDAGKKALVMFGLVKPDLDVEKLIVDLHTEQIAGFYDWRTQQLYLMTEMPPMMQRMIMAHELTHALQDQHFDLKKLPIEEKCNDDLLLATQSLVEGDALISMIDYMLEPQGLDSSVLPSLSGFLKSAAPLAGGPVLDRAPTYFRETLLFPYVQGLEFLQAAKKAGGWDMVNAAYATPPASCEQILHPEKYLSQNDMPTLVELPDLAGTLGPDWRYLDKNVLGEFAVGVLLREYLPPEMKADEATKGWDGDQFHLYENAKSGALALVWLTVWDTERDAQEFMSSYRASLAKRLGIEDVPQATATEWQVRERPLALFRQGSLVLMLDGIEPQRMGQIKGLAFGAKRTEAAANTPKLAAAPKPEQPDPFKETVRRQLETMMNVPKGETKIEGDRYRNLTYAFELTKPKDWKFQEGEAAMMPIVLKKPNSSPGVMVIVQKLLGPVPAAVFGPMLEGMSKMQYQDVKRVKVGKIVVRGIEGYESVFTGSLLGSPVKVRYVTFSENSIAYTLGCTAAVDEFDKHEKDFEAVVQSFRLTAPAKQRATE